MDAIEQVRSAPHFAVMPGGMTGLFNFAGMTK